jgi:[acyl-carrier-protein] S-malonyltransferase
MQQASVHFSELLSQVNMRPPIVPLIANISAQMLNSVEELRHELNGQLTRPVQWTNSVHTMVEHGVETFIELGPKQVLTGLIRRINNQVQTLSLSDVEIVKLLYPTENDAAASLTA